MKKQRNKKGFTLIEVLVVLIIIGIIIAIILPNVLDAINEANERQCAANIRSIETATQLCFTSTRNWAACNQAGLLAPLPGGGGLPPLPNWPVCPVGGPVYALNVDANGAQSVNAMGVAHFGFWPPVDAAGVAAQHL